MICKQTMISGQPLSMNEEDMQLHSDNSGSHWGKSSLCTWLHSLWSSTLEPSGTKLCTDYFCFCQTPAYVPYSLLESGSSKLMIIRWCNIWHPDWPEWNHFIVTYWLKLQHIKPLWSIKTSYYPPLFLLGKQTLKHYFPHEFLLCVFHTCLPLLTHTWLCTHCAVWAS